MSDVMEMLSFLDCRVVFDQSRMVTPEQWQEAIRARGFALGLETAFDPFTYQGFVPCEYEGRLCGFDYFFDSVAQVAQDMSAADRAQLGARGHQLLFYAESSVLDMSILVVAAAVFCELTDGLFMWGGETPFMSGKQAVTEARGLMAEWAQKFAA